MIRRNILANVIGGSFAILLNLVLIPFEVRILGPEAFGLISLIASLQIIFSVFDFGFSTLIVREVARDISSGRQASRELIQTLATVYWLVALALGAALFLSAGWIAKNWVNLQALSQADAQFGIQILGLYAALRWPVALYGGIITGLQALITFNILRAINAVLRLAGGLAVLLLTRELDIFLWWLAVSAAIEVILYMAASFRLLPGSSLWPHVSFDSLRGVWKFSLSMNLISILAIVFTQADRVFLSRLMPLEDVGYYSLAMTVVMSISVIQGFITSAVFPSLASDHRAGQKAQLIAHYGKATQILIYTITLPICVLVFFGYDLLRIWVSPEAAGRSYVALSVLSLGFLLNASAAVPYTLSVATGHTRLPLFVNAAAVLIYLPGLYFLIGEWGIVGAAAAWFFLNLYYLFSLVPLVQKRIMQASVNDWLNQNLFPFLVIGGGTFSVAWAVGYVGRLQGMETLVWGACLVAGAMYTLLGFRVLDSTLRSDIREFFKQAISRIRSLQPETMLHPGYRTRQRKRG